MNKAEEMKQLRAQKKELNEKQKALREELNATKAERLEKSTAKAIARKESKRLKAELRTLTSSIYKDYSDGEVDVLNTLATEIVRISAELSEQVTNFASACEEI